MEQAQILVLKFAANTFPKNIKFVEKVSRAPNGKADYKWAKELAKEFINA